MASPKVTSVYRKLLAAARQCDATPAYKALLQSPFSGQEAVDLFNAPLAHTVRQSFRSGAQRDTARQLAVAEQGVAELQWQIHRRRHYAIKRAQEPFLPPLTPNQEWFEARLREPSSIDSSGGGATSCTDPLQLLQDAVGSGSAPTLGMCTAAAEAAGGRGGGPAALPRALAALRTLDHATPHPPSPQLAGAVVEGVLGAGDALRGLAAAEAFVESGVHPSSAALTAVVHAVRDLCASPALEEEGTKAQWLQRLGKVLVPELSTPLTNLGALQEYIRACERRKHPLAHECAERAQGYVIAHTMFAEQEAEGDEIMGLPMD